MKSNSQAVLDRLEGFFTQKAKRWRDNPPPAWLAPLIPDRDLQPTEKYSFQLYLRQATPPAAIATAFMIFGWIAPFAFLRYEYPPLWQDPKYHKVLIGLLSREGLYSMPLVFVGIVAFSYIMCLPRFYFWNRRAVRLQQTPFEHRNFSVVDMAVDPGVWPPPPNRPAV